MPRTSIDVDANAKPCGRCSPSPGADGETLKLVESLRQALVVRDRSAERFGVRPMSAGAAIAPAVGERR